ncbi:hypothetical protein [Sediminicurvatus halobius]|uniref:Uncharacterized protein n=1 Tax=Sediminicurvatus halobius TaxID=2182432 RepID=A0A2U2N162_9GAMM|nr:hypothetical protein [Spiribacter halobius]PWG62802.1 hypothetical protein DEM34_10550 [Spiribacter halobius]UEX77051.1 hypothetical protein LMH63_14005 [Spiribacter halobius]
METRSTEHFLRQLGDIQQQFLADLVRSSRALGDSRGDVGDVFREQLHCYRRAVDDTLRLEHELCESLKSEQQSGEADAGLARFAADLAETGIEFREQLWHTWFETADRLGDGSLGTFVHPLRFWSQMLRREEGSQPAADQPPAAEHKPSAADIPRTQQRA